LPAFPRAVRVEKEFPLMSDLPRISFFHGHATHPDPSMALALVAAQVDAQRAAHPGVRATLGLMYLTDHYGPQAQAVLDQARQRWPGVQWVGTVGIGVAASGVEYWDEPALVLMLLDVPEHDFRVFNGQSPLAADNRLDAWTALVHADPTTPDISDLLIELADDMGSRKLFGGLSSTRNLPVQLANAVFTGGLSGVAFGKKVGLISRVTQGCQPIGPTRTVTAAERNLILALDGQPALGLLLTDLGLSMEEPDPLMRKLRSTLVGLTDAEDRARDAGGQFGADTRVRHLVGLDPGQHAVAISDWVTPGQQLSFCQRDMEAARRDLVRICAEIREELAGDPDDPSAPGQTMLGAVYVSCTGRGGGHFGGASAELQIVQHALGEVPLVGFFAAGEIAGRHLVGYTGVLTVFTAPG
jgi:small ligand-binding sensory domain FIST